MADVPDRRGRALTDAQRLAHERAADAFFSRARTKREVTRYVTRESSMPRERARNVLKKAEAVRRRRAVDRARVWNEAHPEQRRAQLQRWRDRNREKVRAQGRDSYERNRDAIAERAKTARDRDPDKYAQRSRDWHERHPGYATEYGRRYRQDPERYARQLKLNRDRARLIRRLQALELPPRSLHRTTAAEKRANARDAETFYTSSERRAWFVQYQTFHDSVDEVMTARGASLRALAEAQANVQTAQGRPPVDVDLDTYTRAVGLVLDQGYSFDLLTGGDVRRAVESVQEFQAQRVRALQADTLRATLTTYVQKNTPRLAKAVQLENRARELAGKPPLPGDVVAHQIAFESVRGQLDLSALTAADAGKIVARVRESRPGLFDPPTRTPLASPAGVPGVPGVGSSPRPAPVTEFAPRLER